jgi:hypothetical protein
MSSPCTTLFAAAASLTGWFDDVAGTRVRACGTLRRTGSTGHRAARLQVVAEQRRQGLSVADAIDEAVGDLTRSEERSTAKGLPLGWLR